MFSLTVTKTLVPPMVVPLALTAFIALAGPGGVFEPEEVPDSFGDAIPAAVDTLPQPVSDDHDFAPAGSDEDEADSDEAAVETPAAGAAGDGQDTAQAAQEVDSCEEAIELAGDAANDAVTAAGDYPCTDGTFASEPAKANAKVAPAPGDDSGGDDSSAEENDKPAPPAAGGDRRP